MEKTNMICSYRSTIRDAMKRIDLNGKKVVFCENDKHVVVGVLTDGDIRKLLIDGFGMNECIEFHMNRNFVYAFEDEPTENIIPKFENGITIIPIVDSQRRLVDYMEYNGDIHIPLAQPLLNGNEYQYLMDAFLSTWISSTGKYVNKFEESFSNYCGMRYGIAVSNGTAALHCWH